MSKDNNPITVREKGIAALYAYTPFKLRPERDQYTSLLVPVSYLNLNNHDWLRWRSQATHDEYKIPLPSFDKDVVHPQTLYPKTFTKSDNDRVVYQHRDIDNYNKWRSPPVYIEYSYEALEDTNYCDLGWVLSSSDTRCPVRKHCDDMEKRNDACKHYRNSSFTRLYNVFPNIEHVYRGSLSDTLEIFKILNYRGEPLATVGYADDAQYQAFINGVNFSAQEYMKGNPSLFTQKGIGFSTENINSIEITFQDKVLEDYLYDLIESDKTLHNWVALKHYLYIEDSYTCIDKGKGYAAFDQLSDELKEIVDESDLSDSSQREMLPEIIEDIDLSTEHLGQSFLEVIYLHTLAHLLKDRIVSLYGCGEGEISYYLNHPDLDIRQKRSQQKRLVLFETAIGGFGYLDDFKRQVAAGENSFNDVFQNLRSFLKVHTKETKEVQEKMENQFNSDREIIEYIRDLMLSLDEIDIYPHPKGVRSALYEKYPDLMRDQRDRIDSAFEKTPTCWDGCEFCASGDRDCSFHKWDQPLLISRSLATKGLGTLVSQKEEGDVERRGIERYHTLQGIAQREVCVQANSPGPEFLNELFDLAIDSNESAGVKLLIDQETLQNLNDIRVQDLNRAIKEGRLKCRVSNSKCKQTVIIFDEAAALHGKTEFSLESFSLASDISYTYDLDTVDKMHAEFMDRWEDGKRDLA